MRVHLAEVQVPTDEESIRSMVGELHDALTDSFAVHIDCGGHAVLPLRHEDVVFGKKYVDVLGETGATYYLRRKFKPMKYPDWGMNNEGIMNAFYHKKSIRQRGTIKSVGCSDEWVADGASTDED